MPPLENSRNEVEQASPQSADGVFSVIPLATIDTGTDTCLQAIFECIPAFLTLLRGPEHRFMIANAPCRRLIGDQEYQGRPVRDLLPVNHHDIIQLLDRAYSTGQPVVMREQAIFLRNSPSSPLIQRFLDFTYHPFRDTTGAVAGILVHGVDITEKRAFALERERMLAETHARAEREALLNAIGHVVRDASLTPEEVQYEAVQLLGQALRLDRCYFVVLDVESEAMHVDRDWHRADLASVQGCHLFSRVSSLYDAMYSGGILTTVYEDVERDVRNLEAQAILASYQIRSLVSVAFRDTRGNIVAALRAAMADAPRVWTSEEINLIESVAALVRNSIEAARVQLREHNVAQQLQAALTPQAPPQLPGLALAGFYQPALDEATVGGDFWDVFPKGVDRTMIVVGDLSGKGLTAAAEVATVRNMLRYALYTSTSIADAVAKLNQVLVQENLLTGFATLFVGSYNADDRTLSFINAGQEPGLLWRHATGTVEMLLPTGSILGGFDTGVTYRQQAVPLHPGDAIALFTDGITEAGPTRKEFLEIDGVRAIFAEVMAESTEHQSGTGQIDASAVVSHVIARVDAHASNGVRDDVALLVGIVQEN